MDKLKTCVLKNKNKASDNNSEKNESQRKYVSMAQIYLNIEM